MGAITTAEVGIGVKEPVDYLHTARNAYDHVPLHRARFDAEGIKPDDIRTLDDLRHLPFTVKSDLRDHYPFGMLARPRSELARLHASSGTTGKPTVVGYTGH